MSNRNRTAGNNWEREVRKNLLDLELESWQQVNTSRYESKRRDDMGVDLVGTPGFNFQCKCTKDRPDYHKLISNMPKDGVNVVLHKYVKKAGSRFVSQGKYASLEYEEFLRILKYAINGGYTFKED